jgi:lysophospholipase L1-like esterase
MEERLQSSIPEAEVWNAGFPGWTSAENTIALLLRDVDLAPDVVILFPGINDLQPAAHRPFDPQYEDGHAEQTVRAMGFELRPLPAYERSLFLETVRNLILGPSNPADRLEARAATGGRPDALPAAALAAFERNLRSYIAVANAHGAVVVLATQPLRLRRAAAAADRAYLAQWITGLDPDAVGLQLDRLNDVSRRVAAEGGAVLADVALEVKWRDADFADPMHFSKAGSMKMAEHMASVLEELMAQTHRAGDAG